jgi:hypothetical protein
MLVFGMMLNCFSVHMQVLWSMPMIDVVENDDAPLIAGSTLWVVGHAIYLPAAAAASVAGCRDQAVIFSSNTREAEGYLIDLESCTA